MQVREHSVFAVRFSDDSIYFAARKTWPEGSIRSLKWAENKAESSEPSPMVKTYIKHQGMSQNVELFRELSRQEARLIESNLIRHYRVNEFITLNVKEDTEVLIINETRSPIPSIQRYCKMWL